ncbi:hypothetical protein ACFW2V_13700 [Streptomyces sp. NPDC058947]|uniref:hypothetical protein n=1 Tax=Streptomyces sp. NPDC058947 TaxID=3346675 RepID=UPI0036D125EF
MNEILKHIEGGRGLLTEEEKAALEEYAESTGAPKIVWQVYDDSGVTDEECLGTEKVGPQHLARQAAIDWASKQGFRAFSIYEETRCCTRQRVIWYAQARSYSYSAQ